MSERSAAQSSFLSSTKWADWARTIIAQDASARSYTRLSDKGQSVILMNAPPSSGENVGPFMQISETLHGMDLAPPKILAKDQQQGFLILEDLGTTDFVKAIAQDPTCEGDLYRAAADVLVHIANQPTPDLAILDAKTAGDMVRITAEHYAQADADALAETVTQLFRAYCQSSMTLALRDYHAENLIWRPQETGLKRVGLLDFQDAFVAPSGYDLASLLRDVRRDVDVRLATEILGYVATQTAEPIDQLSLRVRCLAIQRNLRILGVFAKLIRVQGKTRYATFLPRVWRYINDDLNHPALTDLRNIIHSNLPAPDAFQVSV